jgi:hypothetical protein
MATLQPQNVLSAEEKIQGLLTLIKTQLGELSLKGYNISEWNTVDIMPDAGGQILITISLK